MRKHFFLVMALAAAMALSTVAPALAKGGPPEGKGPKAEQAEKADKGKTLERGNWLSGVAVPVELTAEDITVYENGMIKVAHEIGTVLTLVQREPARYKQNVVTQPEEPATWSNAWLGVAADGTPLDHKGELHWYYEVDEGDWVSLTFEFDGEGNLLRVNDVIVE